ncbi:MAG: hypothetical protein A2284_16335 [Deltaproteobacteria bacterium RIFOXYA12_FULL_61_11]|nr:MAG: hypothetical protein A2284_16335 [Deltaproteobacteria bacterium RIFOXYA12_FULL_61_11]
MVRTRANRSRRRAQTTTEYALCVCVAYLLAMFFHQLVARHQENNLLWGPIHQTKRVQAGLPEQMGFLELFFYQTEQTICAPFP